MAHVDAGHDATHAAAERQDGGLAGAALEDGHAFGDQTFEDAPAFNVVGELVGREHPEQIVVVGGLAAMAHPRWRPPPR